MHQSCQSRRTLQMIETLCICCVTWRLDVFARLSRVKPLSNRERTLPVDAKKRLATRSSKASSNRPEVPKESPSVTARNVDVVEGARLIVKRSESVCIHRETGGRWASDAPKSVRLQRAFSFAFALSSAPPSLISGHSPVPTNE